MMVDFVKLNVLLIVLNDLILGYKDEKKSLCQFISFVSILIEVSILWRIVDLMSLTLIISHPVRIQFRDLNLHDFFSHPYSPLPLGCSGPGRNAPAASIWST